MHHRRRRNDEQILFKRNQTSIFPVLLSLPSHQFQSKSTLRRVLSHDTTLFSYDFPTAHEKTLSAVACLDLRNVGQIQNNLFVRFPSLSSSPSFSTSLRLLFSASSLLSLAEKSKSSSPGSHVVRTDRASHSPPSVVLVVERRKARRVDQHLVSLLSVSLLRGRSTRGREWRRAAEERESQTSRRGHEFLSRILEKSSKNTPRFLCLGYQSCFSPFVFFLLFFSEREARERERERERERGRERREEEEEEKKKKSLKREDEQRTGLCAGLLPEPNAGTNERDDCGGELERDASAREHVHRQRENRKRLLSVLKSSKANVRATKLWTKSRCSKSCAKIPSQHKRSKLFQSLRRVVKECTFLLKNGERVRGDGGTGEEFERTF